MRYLNRKTLEAAEQSLSEPDERVERDNAAVVRQFSLLLAPFPTLAALLLQDNALWWIYSVIAVGLAIVARLSSTMDKQVQDFSLSFCFVAHCVLLTSALAGHAWQIDAHMLFFAGLAIVSTLGNPSALLFATGLVAVHHLSFGTLIPSLIYPGAEATTNLNRTIGHAAIVVLETAALLLNMKRQRAVDDEAHRQQNLAREQAQAASEAEAVAMKRQKAANDVVQVFQVHLSELARGNLVCEINESFEEEYEALRRDFNSAIEMLSGLVREVKYSTQGINKGALDIARGYDELSQRTESQAATLEEAAAALEEMTASVSSAAQGARDVEKTVGATRTRAEESGQVVLDAVDAMKAIQESANRISQIISVIDDIAFQTNLLALNAGVEAARAGDAGRGFAVVASEVRGLAQRSAEAATEIKSLIEDSTKQVESGVVLVDKTGEAIHNIVGQVADVSGMMAGIAEGASEQSIGINELNAGVSELDQATQRNAAMVEEATTAGRILQADVEKLAELVSRFEVAEKLGISSNRAA